MSRACPYGGDIPRGQYNSSCVVIVICSLNDAMLQIVVTCIGHISTRQLKVTLCSPIKGANEYLKTKMIHQMCTYV
jgi:hypothetical protein